MFPQSTVRFLHTVSLPGFTTLYFCLGLCTLHLSFGPLYPQSAVWFTHRQLVWAYHPIIFRLGLCTLHLSFWAYVPSIGCLVYTPSACLGTHYLSFGTMHPKPFIWACVPSIALSVYAPSVLPYRYYYPPFSWVYAPVIFMWVYAPIIFVLVTHLLLLSGFMHLLPSFLGFLYTRHLSPGFVYPQFAVWFTNHYFIPDFIHLLSGLTYPSIFIGFFTNPLSPVGLTHKIWVHAPIIIILFGFTHPSCFYLGFHAPVILFYLVYAPVIFFWVYVPIIFHLDLRTRYFHLGTRYFTRVYAPVIFHLGLRTCYFGSTHPLFFI
jgi:hypothetical protein